jgi:type IV pilus assembly protein PilO
MAIDADYIKKMPPQAKALSVLVIIVLITVAYYFLIFGDLWNKKSYIESKINEISAQIKEKEKIALQLDKYIAEVETLKENYKVALEKLPDQREIPGLFHSVASSGKETSVDFLLFQPLKAVPKSMKGETIPDKPAPTQKGKKAPKPPEPFYEEIPVKVTVVGNYQNILHFFEKIAKLPRIVNVSEITIGDRKEIKGRGYFINSTCTVKTYMFIDKKAKTDGKSK